MLWSIDACQNKGSTWPFHGRKSKIHWRLFLSWPLTNCRFSIGSRARVMLICVIRAMQFGSRLTLTQVRVNQSINFSCIQMFFTALNSCSLRLFKLRTEGQTIYRTSPQSCKTQVKIIAYSRALNNPAQGLLLLGLDKSIYYMEESVLLGTKPLVHSIRHFIQDPSSVYSVCHLSECRIVQ